MITILYNFNTLKAPLTSILGLMVHVSLKIAKKTCLLIRIEG